MNTEFEKYTRKQFDGHEVEVDTDLLWANVYPHVKKEKDNRRIIWFFLFGLLAGILTISLFNYNQQDSTDTKDLNEVNQTTINNITEKKHNVEQNNLEQPSTPLSLNATTNQSANPIAKTDHTSTKVKNPNNATTRNITNSNTTSTSTAVSTIPPIIATSINRNIKSEIGIANVTNTKTPTSYKQAPTDTREESSSKKLEIPFLVGISSSTNLPLLNILNYIVTSQNKVLTIPRLAQKIDEATNDEDDQKDDIDRKKKELDRSKRSRKNIRLGLGLYGGVSRSTTNFSLNDSIGLNYAAERNTSEKRLETLHFGFEVSVHTKNGFYLRSGAEYTRIASLFSANSSLITTDSMVGIREIIINTVTGQRDSIMGMIPVTTTTEFTKRHYNYVHLIDIPIIVGYQWEYAPWSIGVEGGIYANISTKHTGEISSPENDAFYDLKKDENKWFKTNIGIQPFIGFHATYHLSDNFQIHLSPSFRFDAVFSTDENLLREKHSMLGLRAGVRYIFD